MKCPECGSGDVVLFKVKERTEIYKCNTCGEEFVRQQDID